MGSIKLSNILVESLTQIEMANGNVLHAMKSKDLGYVDFGEAYFSWIKKGAIKAWKCHRGMTMNLIVPVGNVKFVFCILDDKKKIEEYRVELIGVDDYKRLTVPPGIWFGFQGMGYPSSLVLNIADIPHHENEVERLDLSDIDFEWNDL
jgi:dTDP-4-dehydrorhamnose 3,5-epimerase